MQVMHDKVLEYALGGSLPAKDENELEVDLMTLGPIWVLAKISSA